MDATEGVKQKVLQVVLVQLEPAGTVAHANGKFRYWKSTKQQHKSWQCTASWNHVVVSSWRKNNFGRMQIDANEKNQRIEIDKTTSWIMTTYHRYVCLAVDLHIASGFYSQIGVSLSLSILNSKLENFLWMLHKIKKFMQEQGKNWNRIP
jgi:hypothetical protein